MKSIQTLIVGLALSCAVPSFANDSLTPVSGMTTNFSFVIKSKLNGEVIESFNASAPKRSPLDARVC